MEAVLSWILENAPVLGMVIAAVIITGVVVWRVAAYYYRIREVERRVEKLPCAEHGEAISKIGDIGDVMATIDRQVTEIGRWLMHFDDGMIDVLTEKHSPRMMTGIGEKLFEASGARAAIDENVETLVLRMDERKPATPYDVESAAVDVLLNGLADPMYKKIKDFVYYQPEKMEFRDEKGEVQEVTISMNAIIRLMSIRLRDIYLEKHPEIGTEGF